MKRSVLIIVSSNPRTNGWAAEAVRMAAGLSTHGRLAVTLCLRGHALGVLEANPEDLVDGDYFEDYLPVLAEAGTIGIVGSPREVRNENFIPLKLQHISEAGLEKLISSSDRTIRF